MPVRMPSAMAAGSGRPAWYDSPRTTDTRARRDATDRSMPPDTMTKVMPRASRPVSTKVRDVSRRLAGSR